MSTDQTKSIILFNPRSASCKPRIPNSILQVAAALHGEWETILVDGNMEQDPWPAIEQHLKKGSIDYFGCTVMPGPQLEQAIPISKKIREQYPDMPIIWGGYFASNQYRVCLAEPYVDYVINGPGDFAVPNLLRALEAGTNPGDIENLIFIDEQGMLVVTPKGTLPDYDELPRLPYTHLASFYPLEHYLGRSFLGEKTIAYHSSFGCPFTCSFCGIVPIYNARWKGKSAEGIYMDIKWLKDEYGADAIEFHDNNFFVAEKRTAAFSKLMLDEGVQWWGEGRIDTLDKYSDDNLALMHDAGCRMIFFGAESGNDEVLKQMNKGGKQTGEQIKRFAERLGRFNIIPEYSFVLGTPAESDAKVWEQIKSDIAFIRDVKAINPAAEIIIYIYSPVPMDGAELYESVKKEGFAFPSTLEEWLSPEWLRHDLRKNPMTPWLKPEMVDYIHDFETVLHGVHPTVSDFKLSGPQKFVLKGLAGLRYKLGWYRKPYEIRKLQHLWRYRQPEIEGFYQE